MTSGHISTTIETINLSSHTLSNLLNNFKIKNGKLYPIQKCGIYSKSTPPKFNQISPSNNLTHLPNSYKLKVTQINSSSVQSISTSPIVSSSSSSLLSSNSSSLFLKNSESQSSSKNTHFGRL